jgi:hypothetical protein
MKRNRNWLPWIGFLVAVASAMSYVPVFSRFAITRDLPWVNLLLFLVSGYLLAKGLRRAFAQPEQYRGKISGPVLSVLSLALIGLFAYGIFVAARQLPSPRTALRVGQQAPDFTLADTNGKPVALSQLLQGKRGALLIFYRGYW